MNGMTPHELAFEQPKPKGIMKLLAHFESFYRYRYLMQDLISRDIKVKYRRSFLGLLWSILNPLLMMMVISAVFQNIFRIKVENFPIYYLTGSTIFTLFSESTNTAMTSVLGASSLIKKVYIPKYIFPLEKVMFAFVNFGFSLIAVAFMFLITRTPLHWTALLFFLPALYMLVFSIGVSLVLSSISVFFRDVVHLYSVVLLAWQYLTPIVYPYEALPEKLQLLMKFNPMFHYVKLFRDLLLYGQLPDIKAHLICISFSLFALAVGLYTFKRKQDEFVLFI